MVGVHVCDSRSCVPVRVPACCRCDSLSISELLHCGRSLPHSASRPRRSRHFPPTPTYLVRASHTTARAPSHTRSRAV